MVELNNLYWGGGGSQFDLFRGGSNICQSSCCASLCLQSSDWMPCTGHCVRYLSQLEFCLQNTMTECILIIFIEPLNNGKLIIFFLGGVFSRIPSYLPQNGYWPGFTVPRAICIYKWQKPKVIKDYHATVYQHMDSCRVFTQKQKLYLYHAIWSMDYFIFIYLFILPNTINLDVNIKYL